MLTAEQVQEFLTTLRNPRYCNPDHTGPIVLDGTFNNGIMQFYASEWDMMEYGREVYRKAMDGEFGEIGPYEWPVEIPAQHIRQKVDAKDLFSGEDKE